jgi:hypothetical protein
MRNNSILTRKTRQKTAEKREGRAVANTWARYPTSVRIWIGHRARPAVSVSACDGTKRSFWADFVSIVMRHLAFFEAKSVRIRIGPLPAYATYLCTRGGMAGVGCDGCEVLGLRNIRLVRLVTAYRLLDVFRVRTAKSS